MGFYLKPLHCRDPALLPLKAICTVGHFPVESEHAHYSTGFELYTMWWHRGFCTFSAFIISLELVRYKIVWLYCNTWPEGILKE